MEFKKFKYKEIEGSFHISDTSWRYSFEYKKKRYSEGQEGCIIKITEGNMRSILRRAVEIAMANN
jgi:hypothetical protein